MRIGTQVIPKRGSFKYHGSKILGGSIILVNKKIDNDVTYHVGLWWMKKRLDILCDKNVSPKLKSKFYRVLVTSTMLYGIDY